MGALCCQNAEWGGNSVGRRVDQVSEGERFNGSGAQQIQPPFSNLIPDPGPCATAILLAQIWAELSVPLRRISGSGRPPGLLQRCCCIGGEGRDSLQPRHLAYLNVGWAQSPLNLWWHLIKDHHLPNLIKTALKRSRLKERLFWGHLQTMAAVSNKWILSLYCKTMLSVKSP